MSCSHWTICSTAYREEEAARHQRVRDASAVDASLDGSTLQESFSSNQMETRMDDGENTTGFVQRKVTYWQRVHAWIENVLTQLQGREWRLVHRLLEHRVKTTFATEYASYAKQVRDYIRFLQTVPGRKIASVTFKNFDDVAGEVITSVMKPSRYPPRLVAKLLYGVICELVTAWVRLNEDGNILSEEVDAVESSLTEDNMAVVPGTTAKGKEQAQPGLRTLRALRTSKQLLDNLQKRYKENSVNVSTQFSQRTLGLPADHPRVTALQVRCAQIRDMMETHFQLYHQLHIVFPHKIRQANARSRRSSMSVSASQTNLQQHEDNAANFSDRFASFRAVESQSNEFAKEMHTAYKKFLVAIGAVTGVVMDMDDPTEIRAHTLGPCLWRTDVYSEKRFQSAVRKYTAVKDACDEQVAQFVGHLLTDEQQGAPNASAMASGLGLDIDTRIFNTYANFRFLPLEKVRHVAQSYQAGVAERLRAFVKRIQENYFSMTINKREVRYFIAALSCSPEVAEVMREIQLQQLLRECIVRRDYVSDHGWHQLLSLRNIEHYWRVDSHLADFMGFPLEDLVTKELQAGSEAHGCAYALAYLQLIYPEDEAEWSQDPFLPVAQSVVQKESPDAITFAKDRLLLLGVMQVVKDDRAQLRDIRSTLATIQQRINEKVFNWCTYIRQLMSFYEVDESTKALCGSIYRVVESSSSAGANTSADSCPRHMSVAMSPGAASLSPSKSALSPMRSTLSPTRAQIDSCAAQTTLLLEVNFPWELMVIANDVKYLEKFQLFVGVNQGQATGILELAKQNEHRFRMAQCLNELVKVYYATVNHEDEMIAFLATEEYQSVSDCFFTVGHTIRWNDDLALAQYTQDLSDKVLRLVTAVQEVRDRTEAVYGKIRSFQVKPFHPEGILLRVKEIHNIVNALALRCVNAHYWAKQTQSLLDEALLAQMRFLLQGWTLDFLSMRDDSRYLNKSATTDVYRLKPLRVRMRVVYKEVKLESTASAWRHHWLNELSQFFRWMDIVPQLYNDEDIKHDNQSGPIHTLQTIVNSGKQGGNISAWMGLTMSKEKSSKTSPGCLHLLSRIPAFAVAEPLAAIESSISEAVAVEDEWRQSQQFLNLDVNLMQQRFGTDLRRWSSTIQLMHTVTSQLLDYTQPNRLLGGILILAEDAQKELSRKLDQITGFVHSKFKDILEREVDDLYDKITADTNKLDGLDVISSIEDASVFLVDAPRLRQDMIEREEYVQIMVESEALLQKLGYISPEDLTNAALVQTEFKALKELVDRKLKQLSFRRPQLEQSVVDSNADLDKRIQELDNDLKALESGTVKRTPQAAQQIISELNDRARMLHEEATKVAALQEALGIKCFNTAQIERIMEDTERMKEVWDHIGTALETIDNLGATPFFEMVPRRLHEDLQNLEQQADDYPEVVKSFPIYTDLMQRIENALSCRRFMQDLRSDAMSPLERAMRHWVSLRQQLQANWALESLTVQDIWDSDPNENAVIYNDVIELAQGERRIEVQLHQIAAFWDEFVFSLTVYQKKVALIRGWDQLFERLDDDLATFSGMRASPFFSSQQVVAMTNESENRLNQLRQILETLLDVQKRWVYLEGIFTGNTEIRSQLPHDTVQFERTSKELMHILPHPRSNGTLPEIKAQFFLEDDKLLMTLERIANQLTGVQRALTAYLDTQRRRFPRFFFVGDDDLLEILGNSKDPLFLSKHLRKMFTALSSFDVDGTSLVGFSCGAEDVRYFGKGVVYKDRPLYDWLNEAEQSMMKTLCSRTLAAAGELENTGSVKMNWVDQYPAQVMALALQIWWTQMQDKQFSTDSVVLTKTTPKGIALNKATSPVITAMDTLLKELATSVLAADISLTSRHKCEQAITIAVYQRDTSRGLVVNQVSSRQDFEWTRIMRLYGNAGKQLVECCMADASVKHGFEYSGLYERLVQTPLTDKCYLSLMQALNTRLGGSPIGPAGTGKTETVKALGIQTGRHVLVFNCDDTFDYQAVSRIFLGLCQVGAWGCFDEFNRLEERIMSALSQQIQIIQETLRARQKEITLNENTIPLHENVSIFITMNPGYAGRSKLPGNLKQLFRTVTMTIPDRETIAEVMLFAQGYQSAEMLSLKVVPLFRLCEDQLSSETTGRQPLTGTVLGSVPARSPVTVTGSPVPLPTPARYPVPGPRLPPG
ncbi:dynein heavy chain 1, cytosolic [Angomonas deanei]|uniref:Dynein heavy chain, N-terminal region 2/Hydrolytic ATP binding site of dynein motor region containing protein, putative n=1 Tax=Angomonas deanei TaxID=59799 RepID=A0A7G2CIH6_9TRYP|nr:dynein heavy chain 1, cytosolic [Angomonas deanei]CAD2218433.1 Dynein heavy chain, N-terminal region 2/Hydrolytic ATP binding site of dynein motor region containing protein, putative [Angomonas deanei]|eukprot:EPY34086.1 dynein heavy chain 1, cytosolic [Angomonas deanei]